MGKSCGVDLAAASEGPENAVLGANDIVLVGITLFGSGRETFKPDLEPIVNEGVGAVADGCNEGLVGKPGHRRQEPGGGPGHAGCTWEHLVSQL